MLQIKFKEAQLKVPWRWDVDWSLRPGQVHWLAGANGVGKTSLFNELKARFGARGDMVFVDQGPLAPYQDLTVAQVFAVVWEVAGPRQRLPRWQDLDEWDAESRSWWERPLSRLSGGQNQWVKLMMAMAVRGECWWLDEPFQALDAAHAEKLWHWIRRRTNEGETVVYTHHGDPAANVVGWSLTTRDGSKSVVSA
jgi:ABC-type multidrug transport system ATPase subunit